MMTTIKFSQSRMLGTRTHFDKPRTAPNPFDFLLYSFHPLLFIHLRFPYGPYNLPISLSSSSKNLSILLHRTVSTAHNVIVSFTMGRAPCCDKNGLKKGPWTPEEDQKLVDYIQKHGYGNWRTLPKNAGIYLLPNFLSVVDC